MHSIYTHIDIHVYTDMQQKHTYTVLYAHIYIHTHTYIHTYGHKYTYVHIQCSYLTKIEALILDLNK